VQQLLQENTATIAQLAGWNTAEINDSKNFKPLLTSNSSIHR